MLNVRGYLTGTISSVVLGPCVLSEGSVFVPYDGQSQDVATKTPNLPRQNSLEGYFPLLFMFSGGNRGCEGKCKFFKDGRGQKDFYYK